RKQLLARLEQRRERRAAGNASRERVDRSKRHESEWKSGRDTLHWQIVANVRRGDSKRLRDAPAIATLRTELRLAMRHPDKIRLAAGALDRDGHRPDPELQSRIDIRRVERDLAAAREHPGGA